MLNYFKLIRTLLQLKSIEEKDVSMNIKIPQLTHLVATLLGVVGVPTLASQWLSQPSHLTVYTILVALSVLLHATCPSIFGTSAADFPTYPKLKSIIIIFMLFMGAIFTQVTHSQSSTSAVNNMYMAGASYNGSASPSTAGSILYAHQVNNSGTYAFTMIDALPSSNKTTSFYQQPNGLIIPVTNTVLTVTTNIGAGIAQNAFTIAGHSFFVPTSAGISFTGVNTGWNWSTGFGIPFQWKKTNWYIMPTARVLKSSVSGGTGYQPVIGVLIGWGQ